MGCGSSRPLTEEERQQHAAAVKIQALQRGRKGKEVYAQRREDHERDRAAVKIQAVQRGRKGREIYAQRKEERVRETEAAATKIQAAAR